MNIVEKTKSNFGKIENQFSYVQGFSKTHYAKKPTLWENYGYIRLYIPASAYEQAGYINLLTSEIHGTRPANNDTLRNVLEFIKNI